MRSESVIVCEGYHDRAFWAGWLTRLGCTDPGLKPGSSTRKPIIDPWGDEVRGGQFAYHSQSGAFLRVVPAHGRTKVLTAARVRLLGRASRPLARLLIN